MNIQFEDHSTDPEKVILRKPEYVAFMDVPHRLWVGLTEEEKQEWIDAMPRFPESRHLMNLLNIMEARLKEANK